MIDVKVGNVTIEGPYKNQVDGLFHDEVRIVIGSPDDAQFPAYGVVPWGVMAAICRQMLDEGRVGPDPDQDSSSAASILEITVRNAEFEAPELRSALLGFLDRNMRIPGESFLNYLGRMNEDKDSEWLVRFEAACIEWLTYVDTNEVLPKGPDEIGISTQIL